MDDYLKKMGVQNVKTFLNGKEAVEYYKDNPGINLVLTDIDMPEMNGIEMSKEIRKYEEDCKIEKS